MTTNKLDLAAIKARYEAATEGPWYLCGYHNHFWKIMRHDPAKEMENDCYDTYRVVCEVETRHRSAEQIRSDAEFLSHARTDIPALCDEVERLQHDLKATQSRFETMAELSTDRGVKNEEDKEEIERLKKREDEYADLLASANNDVKRLNEYIDTLAEQAQEQE